MSKPESRLRTQHNALIRSLRPVAIENALSSNGLPDVAHVYGWTELKVVKAWPVRANTPLRIDHYTDEQRRWGENWTRAGGNYWLLVKVAREWLIFTVPDSLAVGNLTREQMYTQCDIRFTACPSSAELSEFYRDSTPAEDYKRLEAQGLLK